MTGTFPKAEVPRDWPAGIAIVRQRVARACGTKPIAQIASKHTRCVTPLGDQSAVPAEFNSLVGEHLKPTESKV